MSALAWEGCVNVRDLGGLPVETGGRTRSGAIVRSDNVRSLTAAGWQALAEHGVTRIVDLRWPEELAQDAPGEVDIEVVDIEVVHVSVLGEFYDQEYVAELDAHLERVDDAADHYAWSYVDFLERFRDRFGRAFAAIADADGTVVVHCMGGKDRTGLVAAILLRLAGVDLATIGSDYALSAANLAPRSAEWVEASTDDAQRATRQKLSETPAEGMVRTLAELERRYGDVAAYLQAAGLSDAQVERLRDRLVAA